MVGDKITNVASSAATTLGDAGLKIIGLERIDKSSNPLNEPVGDISTQKVDENLEKIGDAASGILSDVKNVADKTGAALIENVNEVLGSDIVKETTAEAAKNTADIVKEGAETFNQALNDPEVRSEVEEAIKNAGEIATVVIDASKKPFDKAVDVAAASVPKVSNALVSGAVRVGTDVLATLPGIGTIFDIGRMINDGSRAASSVVEASSEAVEAASESFIEAKHLVEKGLKELEEKKKLAEQISNRTTNSIKEFENPISNIKQFQTPISQVKSTTGGARKSKKRLFKRKAKSKRVRFDF